MLLDAAEAGDGGIPSEIKAVCAESCGSSARDWAEAGGGVRLPAWNNGAVTAVTASITPNQTTTYVSRLGVVQAF